MDSSKMKVQADKTNKPQVNVKNNDQTTPWQFEKMVNVGNRQGLKKDSGGKFPPAKSK